MESTKANGYFFFFSKSSAWLHTYITIYIYISACVDPYTIPNFEMTIEWYWVYVEIEMKKTIRKTKAKKTNKVKGKKEENAYSLLSNKYINIPYANIVYNRRGVYVWKIRRWKTLCTYLFNILKWFSIQKQHEAHTDTDTNKLISIQYMYKYIVCTYKTFVLQMCLAALMYALTFIPDSPTHMWTIAMHDFSMPIRYTLHLKLVQIGFSIIM